MNKYYEWKVLTAEGRLIKVTIKKSCQCDVDLTGTFSCEEEAVSALERWLSLYRFKAPDNLTLMPFFNN